MQHLFLVGALPGLAQEVPLAELFALLQAVSHSVPDERGSFTFYADCMWVIDSFHMGWGSCTGVGHVGSLLWRRLFQQIDDKFGSLQNLVLEKEKAHVSFASCGGDNELIFRRGGNVIVDKKEQSKEQLATAPARLSLINASEQRSQ